MLKYFMLAAGLMISINGLSQKPELINSGEVIESAKRSYDSGNYKLAVRKYLAIQERDTNYTVMLVELALTYLADGDYQKTIETCDKGLINPSEYRPDFLRSKAIALDKTGEYDKSVELFESSLSEFPTDHILIYNYGVTLFNAKEYPKAKEQFFRALTINPFHAGSHRSLARIAMLEGRKVHAMLAMGLYLSISPNDNNHLVMLNDFVLNQITDEGSVPGTGTNSYEKLDQIVRAKMAMDKNFESKYPFDYAIVRQFELVFQQIDLGGNEDQDRYRNFYTALYKEFREKKYMDPFIYNMIKSTGNEQVKKWIKKNDKSLKEFYEGAGAAIRAKRYHPFIPGSFGLGDDYTANYNDAGNLVSVGRKSSDGKMIGKWYFFHHNMVRSAEGSFDESENKTGTWQYFRNTGSISKIENYGNGEMIFYHPEGTKYQHFFMVKDSIEGKAEVFYPCGAVRDRYMYKANKRDGQAFSYFPDGKVKSEYHYKAGKLDGEFKEYHAQGKLMSSTKYKNGNADGPFRKYFVNGKIEISGQYANDQRQGEWSYYYFNGALDRKGVYEEGMGVGEWLFYNEHGELVEKRNFDQKGNFHGDDTFFEGGKPHYIKTYKNNVAIRYVFYDDNGSVIGTFGKDNGTFPLKMYYPTGQISGEGNVKAGEFDGSWKYYFRHGGVKSECTYEDGKLTGSATEYYPGGSRKSVIAYKDGDLHGYYQTFNSAEKVSEEGWYQNGQKQQRWLSYHDDGSVQNDEFYLNGLNQTIGLEYAPDGKLVSRRDFNREGYVIDIIMHRPDGKPGTVKRESGQQQIFETHFANKKTQSHIELTCGAYYGPVKRYFPDGKIFYSYALVNGRREGKFEYYDMRNQLERSGSYSDGWSEGTWKGFEDGRLDYTGRYFNNNPDSTWTYFSEDGKISSFTNYLRGLRHGLTSIRNKDGGESVEKMYQHDDLISYRTKKADGTWSDWVRFTGNATLVSYYSNGQKAFEEEYRDGFVTGVKKNFYANGKIYSEASFRNGDFDGPYIIYYPNGKIKEKREYKSDELHGKVEWFNENGSLNRMETYSHGMRFGKAMIYHNGVKSKEYTFWGTNVYE